MYLEYQIIMQDHCEKLWERSNLRAEAVLAPGRWEIEQTGLWTSLPSIFLSLTAPLARWRRFPFLSVWKKSTFLRTFQPLTNRETKSKRDGTSWSSSFILFLLDSSSTSSSSSSSIIPSMLLDTPGLLVDSSHLWMSGQSKLTHST